nr:hypothetical protein [Tanacetum cinerariifolium]
DQGIFDSGCSKHMIGNKSYLTDYQEIDGGFLAFRGNAKGDKTGLGYDGQINESDLNDIHVNKSEVLNNVVDSCESDGDDNPVNDRFIKELDLKWQVVMLTMRVKRFIKKTGRKLDLNGKDTVGFDRTKVECYKFHRRGHFARECTKPRNQGNRNRDAPIRNAPIDTSTINALVVQDGIGGYDWSF